MAAGDILHCEAHPEATAEAACVVCERLLCAACRHIDPQGLSVCPVHAEGRGALPPAQAIPQLLAAALQSSALPSRARSAREIGGTASATEAAAGKDDAHSTVTAPATEPQAEPQATGAPVEPAGAAASPPAVAGTGGSDAPGAFDAAPTSGASEASPGHAPARSAEADPRAPEASPSADPEPEPPPPSVRLSKAPSSSADVVSGSTPKAEVPRPDAPKPDASEPDDRWPFAAVPDPRAGRGSGPDAVDEGRAEAQARRVEARARAAAARAESGRRQPVPAEGPSSPADAAEASRVADLACPWEGDATGGDISAFARTAALALGAPVRFPALQNWQRGDLIAPLMFALLCVGLGAALSALSGIFGFGPGATVGFPEGMPPQLAALPELPLAVYELLFLPLLPLITVISLGIHAGLAHLLLRMVGATRGPFELTFRVICYAQVAHLVAWLPGVGPYAENFYLVFLMLGGIRGAHNAGVLPGLLALLPLMLTRLPFIGL